MIDRRPVSAALAGGLDQVPGPQILQPEIVARRKFGHRFEVMFSICFQYGDGNELASSLTAVSYFSRHLPFFGSGRKSTIRLCPVAAAMRCSVRIVAWLRPRSRRATLP
jgi:hypothetical protein